MPRAFQWFTRINTGQTVVASGQDCTDLLVGLSDVNTKGATLTRLIFRYTARPAVVGEVSRTTYGIAVVNADAAAAGAFPDPSIEGDNVRWFMRDLSVNVLDSLSDRSQWVDRTYDLRGQVRFRSEQEELHLIVDQDAGGALNFDVHLRMLVKLP